MNYLLTVNHLGFALDITLMLLLYYYLIYYLKPWMVVIRICFIFCCFCVCCCFWRIKDVYIISPIFVLVGDVFKFCYVQSLW